MIRKIIQIDEEKCNGCGICVNACHEGAIGMMKGKAKLLRDDYCDGLGDCLPTCPTGAITFVEREAAAYDEVAVMAAMKHKVSSCSCSGSTAKVIQHSSAESQLSQWPIQIKLVPVHAPYFNQAHLLVAADCTAFAYGAFHNRFIKNKITLIGCPKLDSVNYAHKLTEIIRNNEIKSVTVVRMEVPCCGGIEQAVKTALQNSGKFIPWQVAVISSQGEIIE